MRRVPSGINQQIVEALAAEIDAKLDQKFGGIERQIQAVAADVDSVSRQTAFLLSKAGVKVPGSASADDGDEIEQTDQTWQCQKCGARLGFYDPAEDCLRIRHKDFVVWIQVGIGGAVSVPCRACSELNIVRDDRVPDPED